MSFLLNPYIAASGLTANLTNHTITGLGSVGGGFTSTASIRLKSNGNAEKDETDGSGGTTTTPFSGEWQTSGANTDFECRMTTTSGSLSGGTAGSWLAMTGDNTWTRQRAPASPGTTTYTGTLEIRRISDSVVVATSAVTLNAQMNA